MLFNVMKTLILLDSVRAIILGGIIQTIAGKKKRTMALTLGRSFWHRCQSHSAWLKTRA